MDGVGVGTLLAAAAVLLVSSGAMGRVVPGGRAGLWAAAGLLGGGAAGCWSGSPGSWSLCGALLLPLLLLGGRLWRSRGAATELLPGRDRAVLITGCDSGFGLALAERLSLAGVTVFAGVLNSDGPGAQRLRTRGTAELQVLQLDVTDAAQIAGVLQHVHSQVGDSGLWGLVNNAGFLHCPADAEIHPMTVFRRCMDVNFLAAVQMCQMFLPLLRRAKGRIVNVTSVAGEVPMALVSAYGASKAALRLCSNVMRLELRPWGVTVATIQPTGFRTNIQGSNADMERYREEILHAMSAAAREDYGEAYVSALSRCMGLLMPSYPADLRPVLDAMTHALLSPRPRALYTPGRMGWLLPFAHRHLPAPLYDILIRRVKLTDCKPAALL